MNIPVLFISYNRYAFTKKAIVSLVNSDCGHIYWIDNGSDEPDMKSFIETMEDSQRATIIRNKENYGIAFAMNQFLSLTRDSEFCIKVDSDTLIPPDFCARMMPHMASADIVQAKHEIIKATNPDGWEGLTKGMKRKGSLLFNSFVGGSGIIFKRKLVNNIPETDSKIMGWRQWQMEHPEVVKAFASDVEIDLLDSEENGGYPEEYKSYYQQTGRI